MPGIFYFCRTHSAAAHHHHTTRLYLGASADTDKQHTPGSPFSGHPSSTFLYCLRSSVFSTFCKRRALAASLALANTRAAS